jgi:hypothetical protein
MNSWPKFEGDDNSKKFALNVGGLKPYPKSCELSSQHWQQDKKKISS